MVSDSKTYLDLRFQTTERRQRMEPQRPDETEEENNEGGNHQPLITSAVVIGIVLALVAIIEMGGLQLWEWIQSLEEVAQ
jgi:hypothetical protein